MKIQITNKILKEFNKIDKAEVNKDLVDNLEIKKFSFSITNDNEVEHIKETLEKIYLAVKENTNATYNLYNLKGEMQELFKKDLVGFNLAQYKDLLFSFNILANYKDADFKIVYSNKNQKLLMEMLDPNKITDEDFKNNFDKIVKKFEKKSKVKYVAPELVSVIIDLYIIYK